MDIEELLDYQDKIADRNSEYTFHDSEYLWDYEIRNLAKKLQEKCDIQTGLLDVVYMLYKKGALNIKAVREYLKENTL